MPKIYIKLINLWCYSNKYFTWMKIYILHVPINLWCSPVGVIDSHSAINEQRSVFLFEYWEFPVHYKVQHQGQHYFFSKIPTISMRSMGKIPLLKLAEYQEIIMVHKFLEFKFAAFTTINPLLIPPHILKQDNFVESVPESPNSSDIQKVCHHQSCIIHA